MITGKVRLGSILCILVTISNITAAIQLFISLSLSLSLSLSPPSLCSQCVTAIRSALCVLAVVVDNAEIKEKMADWGVSDMLELVTAKFPDFATRSELCHRITTNLPGYVPPPDTKEELTRKQAVDKKHLELSWYRSSKLFGIGRQT